MMILSEWIEGKQAVRSVTELQFEGEFDVIVCGLGTAGSLAALLSAENGLSVLGIEAFTCPGGTHTAGGIANHYFGCPGGRYEELDQAVLDFTARYTCTQPESRKLVLEQALLEQGAELLYETLVCGVYLQENCVIGVRALSLDGIKNYRAKVVMDCTAEASVAVLAGCKTEQGRDTDGQMQPYSLVSMVFDGEKYGYTNADFGRVDQTDPWALSEAILFARSYPMKEGVRGREVIAQMPIMGFREGRRICAEEMAEIEDLFADRQTETPAFYAYADLDKHGWDLAFDGERLGDWAIGANLGAYNVTVAVPYQAILPKGFEGILVPCRALGVDRDISSCVRMIPDMKKIAEVAAEWATLAICKGSSLRQVPYEQLKKKLQQSGCLKQEDNRGVWIAYKKGDSRSSEPVIWVTDPAGLEAELKTLKPGRAIWSVKRMGTVALPCLRRLVTDQNKNTSKHAAFALAILGNEEGNAVLRQMVVERDEEMLLDCRKNNNLRGWMAIYWLGRLADREITEELIRLICDPKEIERPVYSRKDLQPTRYEVQDFAGVYFQFVSQAVMALVRIGEEHPDLRPRIKEGVFRAFSSGDCYGRFTQRPRESSEGNMVLALQKIAFDTVEKWNKG